MVHELKITISSEDKLDLSAMKEIMLNALHDTFNHKLENPKLNVHASITTYYPEVGIEESKNHRLQNLPNNL